MPKSIKLLPKKFQILPNTKLGDFFSKGGKIAPNLVTLQCTSTERERERERERGWKILLFCGLNECEKMCVRKRERVSLGV